MIAQNDMFPEAPAAVRTKMNGKTVYTVPAKSVINFKSAFEHKLLCDGLTFSTGSACAYSCSFCYVPDMMRKSSHMTNITEPHEAIVLRREGAIAALRSQLIARGGLPKFSDPDDRRVIYSSPLVDVAANLDLVRETVDACKEILTLTNWQIRLLSKSNLLPHIALALERWADSTDVHGLNREGVKVKERMIFGVSTGTLDDGLAKAFEEGTPLVSKRIQSLHWLQDNGWRTYGMLCPSLPLGNKAYYLMALNMAEAIRAERCEHVWAEVINLRGESFTRTINALRDGGFNAEADALNHVSTDGAAWEEYARLTFQAHAEVYAGLWKGKLRFLQYVTAQTKDWWAARVNDGAVLL